MQAQDGTVLQLKKNDIADMTIERDMFGYLNGYMERRKLFGRTARMDIVISELENSDSIQIMANFDVIIAAPDNTSGIDRLRAQWFSTTNPHMDGVIVIYQKL